MGKTETEKKPMYDSPPIIYWTMYEAGDYRSGLVPMTPASFLHPLELQRMEEVRLRLRRDAFVIGRWAAKALLKRTQPAMQHLPPCRVILGGDVNGLMDLTADRQAVSGCLAISTSGRQAFCAVTYRDDLPLGASLEHIHPRADSFLVDYFTHLEIQELRGYPAAVQNAWMALAWSVKAAVLTALGAELRVDAREIVVSIPNLLAAKNPMQAWLPVELISAPGGGDGWKVMWQLRGEYIFTIAVWMGKSAVFQPVIKEVTLPEEG